MKVNLLLHLLSVKKQVAIWLSLVLTSIYGIAAEHTNPVPVKGVLDLRNEVVDEQTYISLNGEWNFHWQELMDPESAHTIGEENSGIMVTVPSYWNSYEVDGETLPGWGYGTYQLTIILPENHQSAICFDIPVFDVAYKFYLNDWLVDSNGKVGTSPEEEEPWYEPSSFCFKPDTDTLHLLIQVSNFHHRRGGFWKSIYTGGATKVMGKMEHQRMYNYSTIGVLFFFFLFYLIFWFFSKWNKLMLLFALTALGILIRSVNTGLYFSNAFIETPWVWQIRMEYLGSYMAFIFGMMFLNQIFPTKYMKHIIKANTILFTGAAISLFLLPPHLFTYEMLVFQPALFLFLLHYLVKGFIGAVRGKVMDAIFFVSLGLFMYALVNDILLANTAGALHNNYLTQISFQVFIFAMSVLIIMQWVRNYNTRLQLESSLRFKNRVLSVIAHDLKNPVASVAQFSELLADKPDLAHEDHIINSLKESSQAAVTLLDNLLYWGRSQADDLIVNAVPLDIEKLANDVQSLYVHMMSQKQIEFKVEIPVGIKAYGDKALVNIVLRNLLSNAIKFTPKGGSIQLKVFEESDSVRCKVIDNGVGIKPEILEEFEKTGLMGSSAGTDREVGTGLGLQLVRDLVYKNGGSLQIESTLQEGSTFSFTIPKHN